MKNIFNEEDATLKAEKKSSFDPFTPALKNFLRRLPTVTDIQKYERLSHLNDEISIIYTLTPSMNLRQISIGLVRNPDIETWILATLSFVHLKCDLNRTSGMEIRENFSCL